MQTLGSPNVGIWQEPTKTASLVAKLVPVAADSFQKLRIGSRGFGHCVLAKGRT